MDAWEPKDADFILWSKLEPKNRQNTHGIRPTRAQHSRWNEREEHKGQDLDLGALPQIRQTQIKRKRARARALARARSRSLAGEKHAGGGKCWNVMVPENNGENNIKRENTGQSLGPIQFAPPPPRSLISSWKGAYRRTMASTFVRYRPL